MPISKRQLVLNVMDAGLKTITTANGYDTNLGASIYEWREEPVEQEKLPAAIWRDTDEPVDETFGQHLHKLNVAIELLAAGSDSPAQVRTLIADVVKMIGADLTWGGLAEDTLPQTESIHTDRESKRVAGATVTFLVLYTTNRFDPYQ